MIHSMTAFARTEEPSAEGTLCWEIRSVNHRYLEPHLRLPDAFRELEGPVRESLRKSLGRGKVECTLRFQDSGSGRPLQIDESRAREVIETLRQLTVLVDNPAPVNTLELLAWPGVTVAGGADPQVLNQTALKLFERTLAELRQGREREGEQLARLLGERLDAMGDEVTALRARVPQMLDAQRQKILDRCAEWAIELDPQRLEQELVLLAQKSDVAEELDRLETHIAEVRRVLKAGGAAGRRLDFLMQELNREANTLGSKAFDPRSTQAAVNLKVLIEQMREQVQNIE